MSSLAGPCDQGVGFTNCGRNDKFQCAKQMLQIVGASKEHVLKINKQNKVKIPVRGQGVPWSNTYFFLHVHDQICRPLVDRSDHEHEEKKSTTSTYFEDQQDFKLAGP